MADRPTQDEAEAAVRTLIRWPGDDPDREGLLDTPRRVAKSYKELTDKTLCNKFVLVRAEL